jgi:peptide/nickel transport system substrate-binding protein
MRPLATAVGVGVITTAPSACSGGRQHDATATGGEVVNGATSTLAESSDRGDLDPQATASTTTVQLTQSAYDNLVHVDAKGTIDSGPAIAWQLDGTKVDHRGRRGVPALHGAGGAEGRLT